MPSLLRDSCLFPFKGIVRFRGAMPLLVPLTLNNIWILILAFSRRITFYWYSDYSLCEIIAPVEWSLLDSIFKTYAPLVLGVRGPSSSVCLSFEVPVLNPAGSSRVSPVRSDLSFEGFFFPLRPRYSQVSMGYFVPVFEGFLLLGTLLVNFQNQFVFPCLPFLLGLLFYGRPESEWL